MNRCLDMSKTEDVKSTSSHLKKVILLPEDENGNGK